MSLFTRAIRVLKDEGAFEFSRRSYAFVYPRTAESIYKSSIRRYLPSNGYYTENGVKVEDKHRLDVFFLPHMRNLPEREDGIVTSHQELTQSGDDIVVIGGGNGVTAVRAAMLTGETGEVTIYEGGKEAVDKIRSVLNMNRVDDQCDVHHAIVGAERNVYGGESTTAAAVSPDEIPDCDVLELDCEGSEIDILTELSIQPRAIIAELHPWLFQSEPETPLEILSERGYEIKHWFGHDGTTLSEEEFNTLLSNSNVQGERYVKSGGRWPVVIAAVRPDS
jgi:hypothetical protein